MILEEKTKSIPAKYGLPTDVQFCKKCVISNQRPCSDVEIKNEKDKKSTIDFDEKGICSACRYSEIKNTQIDWKERERKLQEVCERFRSRNGSYDCVIPGSGGKDSAYTAHILKYKYGMNPLTVTWAPHIYTDIGWKNFQSWIHSGFDNILSTPNGKVHRLLTKLAFVNLTHPFQPFIIGQRIIGPKFAALHDIPLVFYGENQAEYGNSIDENNDFKMNPEFYSGDVNLDELFLGGVSASDLIRDYGISRNDLNPYLPLDKKLVSSKGLDVHYLGYYLKWDPQECYYYAHEHTGFQPNTERTEGSYSKYSSIDDKLDALHYYTTLIKFGIGRATYDASQEIRNNKITRDEGIALVKRYDQEFPKKYFSELLQYLDLSEEEFWSILNNARSEHLWKQENGAWMLRHAVWMG